MKREGIKYWLVFFMPAYSWYVRRSPGTPEKKLPKQDDPDKVYLVKSGRTYFR